MSGFGSGFTGKDGKEKSAPFPLLTGKIDGTPQVFLDFLADCESQPGW